MIEDKQKLITLLCISLRNFVVTHLALKRFEEKEQDLPSNVIFGTNKKEITIPLKTLCTTSKTGEVISPKGIFENCKKSLSRTILAETFELIKEYCQSTSQFDKFKGWKYYNFARIVRNCTSHGTGGRLNKWPPEFKKKGITSVSWKDKSIDESMIGQLVSMTDPEIGQLIIDEQDFVERNLR